MSQYVLALDQGTTSSRAIVFAHDGQIVATAQQEFEQILPSPGHVEHDPEAIWSSQLSVARQALAAGRLNRTAWRPWVSRTSAKRRFCGNGTRDDRSAMPSSGKAASAPDLRAVEGRRLRGHSPREDRSRSRPLLFRHQDQLDSRHAPGVQARAERGELAFGTVDSWLVWKLSQGRAHVTDASNASRTLLFNIHRGHWDESS